MHLRARRWRCVGVARFSQTIPRRLRGSYRRQKMPLPGELRRMSKRVTHNAVVAMLGTPDHNAGSLNNPVELEEFGIHFNEKWTYDHLVSDPAGVPQRVIYWMRYDFVSTMVRGGANEEWRPDTNLAEAVAAKY